MQSVKNFISSLNGVVRLTLNWLTKVFSGQLSPISRQLIYFFHFLCMYIAFHNTFRSNRPTRGQCMQIALQPASQPARNVHHKKYTLIFMAVFTNRKALSVSVHLGSAGSLYDMKGKIQRMFYVTFQPLTNFLILPYIDLDNTSSELRNMRLHWITCPPIYLEYSCCLHARGVNLRLCIITKYNIGL